MMGIVILAYDQLLFRPLVAFADRFRVELVASQQQERSWVMDFFVRTRWLRPMMMIPARAFRRMALLRLGLPKARASRKNRNAEAPGRTSDIVFYVIVALVAAYSTWMIVHYVATTLTLADVGRVFVLTIYTMIRVFILIILASIFWVPIGVWIGLRPKLASRIQPLAQFLAAFPANVVFPLAVLLLVAFKLNPNIWLSILIVFGTQWYILFNVIAGAQAYPNDLKEAAKSFGIHGLDWWLKVMIPGIFPLLRHRCADGLGRLVERRDRRRICESGRPHRNRAGHRLLYRDRDGKGRFPPDRARRGGDERLRHTLQPHALAPALRHRGEAAASGLVRLRAVIRGAIRRIRIR